MAAGATVAVGGYAVLERRWRQDVRGFNLVLLGAGAVVGAVVGGAMAEPNLDDSHLYGIGWQLLDHRSPSAAVFGGTVIAVWVVLALVRLAG
jgi:hypothetical protein